MASSAPGGRSRNLILAAMIFAVAMTFIDQAPVILVSGKGSGRVSWPGLPA